MKKKTDIITFKVDETLLEALKGIENRSDFIRSAILSALDNVCPLCRGTGILTPNQRRHWVDFSRTHNISECADCNEAHLTCEHETDDRKSLEHQH